MIAGFFPVVSINKLRQKIIWSGNPWNLSGEEFIGLKVLCLGSGIALGSLLIAIGFPPVIMLAISVLAYFLPDVHLSSVLKKRQKSIYKDMPIMAGLLATAIKAGVELGPALESVSKNLTGPLGDEMGKTWKEIATGKPRSGCLRNMAKRTGVPIVERFVETINTAEERGSENISQILNNFMNDLQNSQSRKAQEEARKLPTKMLLPLVVCIFLPMLAILMTPVLFMLLKAI
jgi:tight adherence protein C